MERTGHGPMLIVPYAWIGDFVRCHSVVSVAQARWPDRPIDVLAPAVCAPLVDYMAGVRQAIVWDLPRGRLAPVEHWRLARRLRQEGYAAALVMSRKWKAALAPFLARIPHRIGTVGELRFGLINDMRWNEKDLPRMIDRCAALALPRDAPVTEWPPPRLSVPAGELAKWRLRRGVANVRAVALCPGSARPEKQWPVSSYADLAARLKTLGVDVWVIGGPEERAIASRIAANGRAGRDFTGSDLRDALLALAAAELAVANDSGLLHVAAALGTPAIGLFGPSDPGLWAPLNTSATVVEAPWSSPCRECARAHCSDVGHRRMSDIGEDGVFRAVADILGANDR